MIIIFFFIQVVVANAAWLVIENNLLELRARARVCVVACVRLKGSWRVNKTRFKLDVNLEPRVPLRRHTYPITYVYQSLL